jgi:hypothetical protein
MNKSMNIEDYFAILDKRAIDPEQRISVVLNGETKVFRALHRHEINPQKECERRYNEKNREARAAKQKQRRADDPDKVRAYRNAENDRNYHRPFMSIDFEGRNFPGRDEHDASGNVYPLHRVT